MRVDIGIERFSHFTCHECERVLPEIMFSFLVFFPEKEQILFVCKLCKKELEE